jgi:PASTA domain
MAPAAHLYLICEETEVEFASAVTYARQQGVQVVNFSAGFPGQSRGDGADAPGYPDSVIADARAAGILWVNAAGNHGDQHWSGTYSDGDGDGLLNFTPSDNGNGFLIPDGEVGCVYLKWDQWPATNQDYDLGLFESGSDELVAASVDVQDGSQRPVEIACYRNDTGTTRGYWLAVQRVAGSAAVRLDVLVGAAGPIDYQVSSDSIVEQASTPAALADPVRCVVPRVVGQTLASARREIVSRNCGVGRVSRSYSRTRKGRIAAQSPRAGARRAEGARVNLLVSRGRRR